MCVAFVNGRSRNKEKERHMQKFEQTLLIIHKNTPFSAFIGHCSHGSRLQQHSVQRPKHLRKPHSQTRDGHRS